jgi:hypothetical protein
MEKRGQIDKALGALPIFFLVLFIMAVFVALVAAGTFTSKKNTDHTSFYSATRMPILFEQIFLDVKGKEEKMSVLEAFNLTRSSPEGWALTKSKIVELTPEDGCLAFLWTNPDANGASLDGSFYLDPNLIPYGFFSKNNEGKITVTDSSDTKSTSFYEMYKLYSEQKYLEKKTLSFTMDKSRYNFMTYAGVCPNA